MTTTQIGNKVVRVKKDSFGYYKATIAQVSDVSEYGDVLDTKELKTLAGINRWINNHILLA